MKLFSHNILFLLMVSFFYLNGMIPERNSDGSDANDDKETVATSPMAQRARLRLYLDKISPKSPESDEYYSEFSHSKESLISQPGSDRSCVSLPPLLGELASQISSRASSHRTPRNDEPESEHYFSSDYDLTSMLENLINEAKNKSVDVVFATRDFSEPQIVKAFCSLQSTKILLLPQFVQLDQTLLEGLFKDGVEIWKLKNFAQPLLYTIGIFYGNDPDWVNCVVTGSYTPSKHRPPSVLNELTTEKNRNIALDNLTITYRDTEMKSLVDHLDCLFGNAEKTSSSNSTSKALAEAASPESD